MIHGFGLVENNINIVIDPGETKTLQVKLTKPGVFPFYCTNFCSALHQEMQGYLVVKNEGATVPATETVNPAAMPPRPRTDAVDGESGSASGIVPGGDAPGPAWNCITLPP